MKHSKGAKIFAWVTIIMLLGVTFMAYLTPTVSAPEADETTTETTQPTE
ncbi:MAG: hypothetical protein Q8P27_03180 [Candidatus Peregrinibacteria bacterium]|nr:hypothetical protein [Candidatus Peregrinibacteria bacterium]